MRTNNKLYLFVELLRNKGVLNSFFDGIKLLFDKILSIVKISFLRIRGFDIDFSVNLRGGNIFFQSFKNSILVSKNVTLGKNTRITCGGSGKILIKENVHIDDSTFIMAQEKIEIGKNSTIAAFCFITDFNHKFEKDNLSVLKQSSTTKSVSIGDNVWIGTHVVILPGVSIGNRVVIGAGSVVTKDIVSNSIAVGNPAIVIKTIQ